MEMNHLLNCKTLIYKGAEANLYEGTFVGYEVVVKKRLPKKYRHPELDNKIRSLRTKHEAKILIKAIENQVSCPRLLGCNLSEKTLILEKIRGKNLGLMISDITDTIKDVNHTKTSEILHSVGVQVAKLHNAGIIHGDLTPFNVIFAKQPYLFDFGLSTIESDNIEKIATDLLTFESILYAISYDFKIAEKYLSAFLTGYFNKIKYSHLKIKTQMKKIVVRGRYIPSDKRKQFYK